MNRFSPPGGSGLTRDRCKRLAVILSAFCLCLPALSQGRDVETYSATVAQIESEAGPYAAHLTEHLQGLARALREEGDYIGAGKAYKRAIHLTRINEGLYTSRQIPLLQALAETNLNAGRLDQVNDSYGHLEWLYRQAFSRGESLAYTEGLNQISDWHLAVVGLEAAPKRRDHLLKVNQINQLMVKAAQREYGNSDPGLAPVLYKLALSHYYLAMTLAKEEEARQLLEEAGPFRSSRTQATEWGDRNAAEVNRHLRAGKLALQRIRSIYAQSPLPAAEQAEAMALIYLADWELLSARVKTFSQARYFRISSVRQAVGYGSVQKAVIQYNNAHSRLLALGVEPAKVQQYFAQPVTLPAAAFTPVLSAQVESPGENTSSGQLEFVSWSSVLKGVSFPGDGLLMPNKTRLAEATASLNVDAQGKANRVKFIERDRAARTLFRAREEIQAIQFRPAIVGEAATGSSAVILRYKFAGG